MRARRDGKPAIVGGDCRGGGLDVRHDGVGGKIEIAGGEIDLENVGAEPDGRGDEAISMS